MTPISMLRFSVTQTLSQSGAINCRTVKIRSLYFYDSASEKKYIKLHKNTEDLTSSQANMNCKANSEVIIQEGKLPL